MQNLDNKVLDMTAPVDTDTNEPPVDITEALQLYKLSFDDPEVPADSPFKNFIYAAGTGKIMFPIAAYNLTMNDALSIATHFNGDMFQDETGTMYIDTNSVIRCMRLAKSDEADKFEQVTKTLLESTEASIMLKNYRRGNENGIN